MSGSLRLGAAFGVPIRIHYSWFLIFFIVTFSLATHFFPLNYPGWPVLWYWVAGVLTSVLFFASVLGHELAHSVIALAHGIPVRSITLFVFGGVSQIGREATSPLMELLISGAGPFSSLLIAALFGAIGLVFTPFMEPVGATARYLAFVNVSLAVFNMLPGFPLDGGRVFRSLVWWSTGNYHRATRWATGAGHAVAYLCIIAGILWVFNGAFFNGFFLAFIGWFLDNAASASSRQTALREALEGYQVRDLMTRDCPVLSPALLLEQAVRQFMLPAGHRCFLVAERGQLLGMLTFLSVKGVPQQQWDTVSVGEAMTPLARLRMAGPFDDAFALLERMDQEEIHEMPVVEGGRVIGLVARDSLLHFARTRAAFRL